MIHEDGDFGLRSDTRPKKYWKGVWEKALSLSYGFVRKSFRSPQQKIEYVWRELDAMEVRSTVEMQQAMQSLALKYEVSLKDLKDYDDYMNQNH